MRKLSGILSIVMILAVMAALFPSGPAFAAKDPGSITLIIHNRTGKPINFDLTGPNGIHNLSTLGTGVTTLTLDQGWYSFFAGLKCGNRSGKFNLNVSKELTFVCGFAGPAETGNIGISMKNNASKHQYCYDVYEPFMDWITTGHTDKWDYMGTHCQDTPAEYWDSFWNQEAAPYDNWYSLDVFVHAGDDACAPDFGTGYYHWNCGTP